MLLPWYVQAATLMKYLSLVALFVTFHWLSTVELVTATNQTGLI